MAHSNIEDVVRAIAEDTQASFETIAQYIQIHQAARGLTCWVAFG